MLPVKGNGNIKTSETTYSVFEKISCGTSAAIRFHEAEEYRTVVSIDENLEQYIKLFARNNVLNIRTQDGCNISPTKFTVDVYCPVLTDILMSGSDSFEGMDIITVPIFNAAVSGSGKVESGIECEDFFCNISGSGKMIITGNGNNVYIDISGSGIFDGTKFNTKNATVDISGSGDVYVCASDNLKVEISGSGNVYYSGEPQIESSISGSGKVIKR